MPWRTHYPTRDYILSLMAGTSYFPFDAATELRKQSCSQRGGQTLGAT